MKELLEYIMTRRQTPIEEYNFKRAFGTAALAGALLLNTPNVDAKQQTSITQVKDRTIVAKVIAGEAAGEGYNGMYAVACVIQNRGGNPINIVKKPHQFSAIEDTNLMDRNYKQVKGTVDKLANEIGSLKDNTDGATNYVTNSYYAKHKNRGWLGKLKVTKVIGNHTFLKR